MTVQIRNDHMRALVREYVKKGWSLVQTHRNHAKLIPPTGPFVIVTCSRSLDNNAVANMRSLLRRIENAQNPASPAGAVQPGRPGRNPKGGGKA